VPENCIHRILLKITKTDCSGYLMPLHAPSVECARTTVDCRSCYILTCTGSMWQIESGSSSPLQSTDVCTTRRQSTWQTAVSLSPMLMIVNDCTRHTVASWMYCAINEQHSAIGCYLWLDQPSGI